MECENKQTNKEDEMGRACRMQQIENMYKIMVRESEQRRPVRR